MRTPPFVILFFTLAATAYTESPAAEAATLVRIERIYNYRQTGPATFEDDATSLIVSIIRNDSSGVASDVILTGQEKKFILTPGPRSPSLFGTGNYSFKQEFTDSAEIDTALPSGEYTLSLVVNGSTLSQKIRVNFSAYERAVRSTNFESLQFWDGSPLFLAWVMPQNTATPSLTFSRPDGTVVLQAPTYSGSPNPPRGYLSNTSTSILISDLPSGAGDLFTATLRILNYTNGAFPLDLFGADTGIGGISPANSVLVSDTAVLRFPIKRPAPAPIIAALPPSTTVTVGTNATLAPTITGSGVTFVWKKDGTAITGATNATLTFASAQASDAGSYTVTATNSGGSVTSTAATLTVVASTIAPAIATAPANLTVLAGAKSTLGVTAAGTAPFTYQWLRNGTPITGATSATLTFEPTLVSDAAAYSVTVTNSAGSVTSSAATLAITPISRISNISVLTSLSAPADNFTLGYVVGGNATTGPKPLLLRAAGPALAALGVAGTLDDPKLELFAGSAKTAENDNWGSSTTSTSALSAAFTSVGAFPFSSPTSRDAATTANLTTRDNSVKISAANLTGSALGLVLAEIYDATPTDTFTTATPRLLNVSVLKSLGTGLTVGFTIAGTTAKTVLIRAVGPTLGDFGVPGTVADPQLVLFNSSSAKLAENDNWSVPVGPAPTSAALTAAFTATGAFPLPATSRDAALLTTLPPGGYSAQVSGLNNTTGVALVEVYEVP